MFPPSLTYVPEITQPPTAVKHLAASLAVEWARKNIRVNSLRYHLFTIMGLLHIDFVQPWIYADAPHAPAS